MSDGNRTHLRNWVWLFSGFRQSLLGRTGFERLWHRLRYLADGETTVQYRPWDTDPKGVAAFTERNADPNRTARVVLIGYSWGGDCAVDVAHAMNKLRMPVEHLVLCDAVHRSGVFSTRTPLNPLSMTRLPKIVVPDNVPPGRVTAFRQKNDRPAGHRIFHLGREIAATWDADCGHAAMDDCDDFHRAAVAAVTDILSDSSREGS